MLIGSGLQAFASSGKFKPVALDQIRTAGNILVLGRKTFPVKPEWCLKFQQGSRQQAVLDQKLEKLMLPRMRRGGSSLYRYYTGSSAHPGLRL